MSLACILGYEDEKLAAPRCMMTEGSERSRLYE
jgi:hypothetical protein